MEKAPIKSVIISDADREATAGAAKMSLHQINVKIDQLVQEHLKFKKMGLNKDAEVKGALASAYAKVWLRRQ